MQAERCPICKSEFIAFTSQDEEFEGGMFLKTWSCKCEHGHEFYITEDYKMVRWASGIKSPYEEDEVEHFEEE